MEGKSNTSSIKILLVEDHHMVRQGIRALLDHSEKIEIVGEANNGMEAIEKVKVLNPEVILMDLNMPRLNGIEATRRIKKTNPEIKILIFSMFDHENYLIDALDAGANGYLLKNAPHEELIFAICKIANDGIYMAPEFTLTMLERYKSTNGHNAQNKKKELDLTEREIDVLKLVANGQTNNEIASELFISVRTVETRRKNLLEKTGTTNTATLIRFAVINGLLD